MYYEEKLFNDVLMFRTTPDGQWRQVLVTELSVRAVAQAKRIAELEKQQDEYWRSTNVDKYIARIAELEQQLAKATISTVLMRNTFHRIRIVLRRLCRLRSRDRHPDKLPALGRSMGIQRRSRFHLRQIGQYVPRVLTKPPPPILYSATVA